MNRLVSLSSILVLLALFACHTKPKEIKKEIEKYRVSKPLVKDTAYTREYVAEIQSYQNIEIRAKVKGYIESIRVDEGQKVNAGQVLFTIRPKEYEAELLKAKANVKTAELEVQNVKKLAEKNIVSQSELDAAMAKLDEAKAAEGLSELYVSYTTVKAPFSGTIDRLRFKMGSLIDEGTLLTTLSDNKDVYAYFNLSEIEYLDFKANAQAAGGDKALLILANNQPHPYPGKVEAVAGEFDKSTGTIAFRARFSNPEMLLKQGETGKVQLRVELKGALIIPQKATFEMQDRIYVYTIDPQNIVHTRNVVIKQRLSNLYVIESGLQADETILLEGVQSVKEEEKIEGLFVDPQQVITQAEH